MNPKHTFGARVHQLARRGWGAEDIYVALRQYGVTQKYARDVVRKLEIVKVLDRMRKRAQREAKAS